MPRHISRKPCAQPTQANNPLNHRTELQYDPAGRLTGVINEAGVAIERYVHDDQGRVTQVIDALTDELSRTTTSPDSVSTGH
ncbi:RHS repeat domain-containing protein [Hydrogenophaga sp. XSHU_21]